MEEARKLLEEARDNITDAIEIIKEEKPTEVELCEELRENKIQIGSKINEIDLL